MHILLYTQPVRHATQYKSHAGQQGFAVCLLDDVLLHNAESMQHKFIHKTDKILSLINNSYVHMQVYIHDF